MTDEPGVMGNLPRSRPGRRSEKRASEVKPAKPKATRAKAASAGPKKAASAAPKKATATGAKKAAAGKAAAGRKRAAPKPRATGTKQTRARAGGPAATTPSPGLGDERAPDTAVRDERVESPPAADPITAALRFGMSVGDAGLKVVAKLAQRLPRP